jgi:hypothetical protein
MGLWYSLSYNFIVVLFLLARVCNPCPTMVEFVTQLAREGQARVVALAIVL